uniref:Cadherin N-terminal domain-containing protein n=1 Tax=Cyprinus carpio TaxID=7962 RepID=A0A8C1I888_CYPCA
MVSVHTKNTDLKWHRVLTVSFALSISSLRTLWTLPSHSLIFMALGMLLWRGVCAQIRYSLSEEQKEGSVVGNLAKDLGLDIRTLKERRFRIVSTSGDSAFCHQHHCVDCNAVL